jgi:hypothetical protein
MKRKFILIIILATLCIYGCSVSLVPEFSADLESQITKSAKMNDRIYIDLLQADIFKRGFDLYAGRYAEVEAEIHSIRLRNEVRKNNTDMLFIINKLDSGFVRFRDEHKVNPNGLKDGEIRSYQTQILALWKPLLIAEGGLKKAKRSLN